MKVCPHCKSVFPDDHLFCLTDGNVLEDNSGEVSTITAPRFGPLTASLSPDMLVACVGCGLANRANSKFCKRCGQPLNDGHPAEAEMVVPFAAADISPGVVPEQSGPPETIAIGNYGFSPQPPAFDHSVSHMPKARTGPARTLYAVIGVLVVAIVGAGAWIAMRPHPAEAKLDRAITDGRLVRPSGDSAFDYYTQIKSDGADPKTLANFEDRLMPMLTAKPEELIKTVTEPGTSEKRVEEWEEGAKMLEWASSLRPADKQLAAKAHYCRGRVHYLNEQRDDAFENWKKAADFDKKWALPLNGMGLIMNERKDYESARTWLRQAIERDPNWAIPYNNLGSSYYFQKRYGEAAPYYQKAVELAPRWARPHAWLGSIAMETYDYQLAVSEFETVLAPDAVGANDMNLDKIRSQLEQARNMASYY